ncbi:VWA domain-containing protein [Actinomycetospora sp. NBRC 106378]|uniref:VWA domain-containing protein n=1 Tax=Actinomycetospora sp. NBRC 106378 TaxID=3032208 RepID=UPI0024A1475A|nr:VWA domain-containing protein [Actinomycetospora sp. NBRC 106378]GLZ51664.1 hypothetical protein Acsp07_12810 [Actinomycetospora sp. NBRC 106378]
MYQRSISRRNPACIVVLLDRSDSMKEPWRQSGTSLADGATRAVNRLLLDLCMRSTKEVGGDVRDYFNVMVLGYGACPVAGGEGVEPALGGALAGRGIVSVRDLAMAPLAVRDEPSADRFSGPSRSPVWIESVHGYRTPMCQAIAEAGRYVFEWTGEHPDSFPPAIINITDGFVTDSPFDGADLAEWTKRLTTIETDDGPALLFNVFLSRTGEPRFFPTSGAQLPDPGPQLFEMSSSLPDVMVANARAAGKTVEPGARAMCFNADIDALTAFLEIGTRVAEVRDR